MLPSADENDRRLRDTSSGSGFLYRYRDLVGSRAAWLQQIIVDSQIYFASPADFNDPFDCRVRFHADGPFDELRKNLDQLLRERGESPEDRQQKIRRMGNPSTFVRKVAARFQREVDDTGVISLSSTHENILMWSHYACSHSGICLQFRVVVDPPFFASAMPVSYTKDLPLPNLLGEDRHERAQQLLLTKAEDWAYEREWRILEPDRVPGSRSFPPELLSAIIFGVKISKANKDTMMKWIAQRSMPLPVYQAAQNDTKYGLIFKQIAK